MTKQEEINKYIMGWLKYTQGIYDDSGIDYALKGLIWGLHSQGVAIKVEEEPDENRYYGDIPWIMYRDGWRKFEPLINEVKDGN